MTFTFRYVAIFAVSLAVGTSLPLVASQSLRAATQNAAFQTKDGTTVRLHRAVTPKDRQDYGRALQMYNTRLQNRETGLAKPDINNRKSIDFYLDHPVEDRVIVEPVRANPISTSDYVKPPEDKVADDALSVKERAELARAAKVGRCWNFPGFSAGYMTLCKKFIEGKTPANTTGFGNDISNARIQQQAVLRGSVSSKVNLFDGLIDNRSGPRAPYGKRGGRASNAGVSSAK